MPATVAEQSKYAWLSGLMFAGMVAAVPALVLLGAERLDALPPVVEAFAVLIVPFTMFCWIFCTIRALHVRDLYYWTLASTYVNLVMLLIIALLAILVAWMSSHLRVPPMQDPGILALILIYAGTVAWSFIYNTRKTGSIILGLMVTLMQTSFAFVVVVGFFFWQDREAVRRHTHNGEDR